MAATKDRNDQIEKIKQNPATLRVYSSRLRLSKLGKDYQTNCPFHSDSNPSFQIFFKNGTWGWECKSRCGGGNVLQFVEKFDGVSFTDALKKVSDEIGETWEEKKQKVEATFQEIGEDKPKISYSLSEYSKLEKNLEENQEAKEWLLRERGIEYETARKLHFGFRQDLGKICGEDNPVAGKGWIVIPCIRDGRVVGIEYRSMVEKQFRRQPGMETGLFNTTTIDMFEPCYLTEGKFDAAIFEQAGFRAVSLPNASAKMTPQMKDTLKTAASLYLAGDSDSAGTEAMDRLWNDLGGQTFKIAWPDGQKDATDVFLNTCGRDVEKFRELVNKLTDEARANPVPHFVTLQGALMSANRTNLSDHPNRLRMPWPAVDKMAVLLPGSIMALSATSTKIGKTVFQTNLTVFAARKHGEVVLNYQCELSPDEFSNIVASHIMKVSRNRLTEDDYKRAAKALGASRYYVGRNPTLTTVTEVLDLIEAAVQRLGATLVVLDHLHFICRNEHNEVQAQANAMQRIKNMAVKYGLKFIVIGQPRKAEQAKRGKSLHISDFKGSETFASDADAVYSLHREYVKTKDPNNPPKDDYDPLTEVHLLGARSRGDGPTFAQLMYRGEFATFENVSYEEPPPESPEQAEFFI